jgi:hypothetical protein
MIDVGAKLLCKMICSMFYFFYLVVCNTKIYNLNTIEFLINKGSKNFYIYGSKNIAVGKMRRSDIENEI